MNSLIDSPPLPIYYITIKSACQAKNKKYFFQKGLDKS
nr:MAG TPA: hypothetical protein [Caudoviricetes sp.]